MPGSWPCRPRVVTIRPLASSKLCNVHPCSRHCILAGLIIYYHKRNHLHHFTRLTFSDPVNSLATRVIENFAENAPTEVNYF